MYALAEWGGEREGEDKYFNNEILSKNVHSKLKILLTFFEDIYVCICIPYILLIASWWFTVLLLGEIKRQLVKVPLAATISPYLIPKCKLKCYKMYVKPMKDPLGISPSKGNQGTIRGKEKILLTSVGIEPTTSRLDLPLPCRLSYEVEQKKSGTI